MNPILFWVLVIILSGVILFFAFRLFQPSVSTVDSRDLFFGDEGENDPDLRDYSSPSDTRPTQAAIIGNIRRTSYDADRSTGQLVDRDEYVPGVPNDDAAHSVSDIYAPPIENDADTNPRRRARIYRS